MDVCVRHIFALRPLVFPGLLSKVFLALLSPLGIRSENRSRITQVHKGTGCQNLKSGKMPGSGARLQSQPWEAEASEPLSLRLAWSTE